MRPSSPAQAKQASDLIAVLAEMFPNTFTIYKRRRRPLKIGIGRDIDLAMKGAMTDTELAIALNYYTGNVGYLSACIEGADRIDLNGKFAGQVTADQAAHARDRLAARRAQKKLANGHSPPAEAQPSRITFADLRAAAAAKKGGAS